MKNKLGVDLGISRLYQKPYDNYFDTVPYLVGWRVHDFVKFSMDDEHSTWEHINQYVARLGETISCFESAFVFIVSHQNCICLVFIIGP